LKAVKAHGLCAVVNLTTLLEDKTRDGLTFEEAFGKLKSEGADVVGVNCQYGPETIIPKIKKLRQIVDGPIAACLFYYLIILYSTCRL